MKFKHPGDAMRALMIRGRIHCDVCVHFPHAGHPWCRKHYKYPSERPQREIVRKDDNLYCADFEFLARESG